MNNVINRVKSEALEQDNHRNARINRMTEETTRLREQVQKLQAESARKDVALTKAENTAAINQTRVDGLKRQISEGR
jgi:hypothetical protein